MRQLGCLTSVAEVASDSGDFSWGWLHGFTTEAKICCNGTQVVQAICILHSLLLGLGLASLPGVKVVELNVAF